ncbi:MAG: glutamate synthase subunit beta [Rhodospirillales bacterium]|jgi:glutamate synthase (NADPH/NADH) small chain|nr:glutamate synthase subunit beta [Rhodospirillales bacterium]MDP6644715.1 glutamate synthase subunit beta [Rhodospirillales bacterium]MDP6843432.1 glutamate synthase subunit beta [Rhodospirillales bacterium]
MGKPSGFMEYDLRDRAYRPVEERTRHYNEFFIPLRDDELIRQGARCMDCGIPYCHQGCPVNNIIPDWNDLIYRGEFSKAMDVLHSTNNFPEFTGRVCPAPCQEACTLNIHDKPVAIKTIECAIVDRAWEEGWVAPEPAPAKTGKSVAVVGSGPAGMAAAQQLARAGHNVTLFEKNQKIGGLLRYGIPDFKMEKHLIDRRAEQMQAEGVTIKTGVNVGADMPVEQLLDEFDAIALTGGSEVPRDLPIDGRELGGVHFAMDFLIQQNRRVSGEPQADTKEILAAGKNVVVIGGGDTGSDCVGTSIRQGAKNVLQIEIMPKPPANVDKGTTWPDWPMKLRTSSSHEEGVDRDWAITTRRFVGEGGQVKSLDAIRVEWKAGVDGHMAMKEMAGTDQSLKADLVLLAMGFVHPARDGMIADMGVKLDQFGNIEASTDDYQTSIPKVFTAGDMRRGQSLVVWAIREGRQCARAIDEYLMGQTLLPR